MTNRKFPTDTLHLVLCSNWWHMIEQGEKHEEYRRLCDTWDKRIWDKRHALKKVVLQLGYENLGSHDFKVVWEKKVPVKINTKISNGKALYRTEKLFWNGRQG